MEKKRYFKILTCGFTCGFKGDWEYVLIDPSDGMYLLYNPNCNGHSGGVFEENLEDYQKGHCYWCSPEECEEVEPCEEAKLCEESHTEQYVEVDVVASPYFLNKKVVDIYNGYKGFVTAYAIYNTGYEQVLVESIDSTGRPISDWLDIRRIKEEE